MPQPIQKNKSLIRRIPEADLRIFLTKKAVLKRQPLNNITEMD
ncbi:hypothetical protein B0O44_103641 [Pedobacter nutrimenti]|uniref:Uncharacterized protein n=1 Tax=Pedobacter nutrimenti TaxID=1241337 RepID=A0A318UGF9_9SPHI|nr:hypothetical protein B0O44_103641 [Pedobacter nutrimenti]